MTIDKATRDKLLEGVDPNKPQSILLPIFSQLSAYRNTLFFDSRLIVTFGPLLSLAVLLFIAYFF